MKGEIANQRVDRSSMRNHAIGGVALVVSLIGAVFIGLPIAHGGGSGLHAGASGVRGRVGNPGLELARDRKGAGVSEGKDPAIPVKKAAAPTSAQTDTTIEAQVIPLKTWGFDPSQVTRRQGLVFLLVPNRSGVAALNLHLTQVTQSGEADVAAVTLPLGQTDWTPLVNFTPGNYTLSETNHPNWVCQITVTP